MFEDMNMGRFKNLILGTPEQRKRGKALKLKEKVAYQKAYAKGRIERAKERGYRAGKGKSGKKGSVMKRIQKGAGTVQLAVKGAGLGAESYMTEMFGDLGV